MMHWKLYRVSSAFHKKVKELHRTAKELHRTAKETHKKVMGCCKMVRELHMGQFLQGGNFGHFVSYFFKK